MDRLLSGFHLYRVVLFLAATVSVLTPPPAWAVTLEAQWGFADQYRPGCWTPASVIIDNSLQGGDVDLSVGEDLKGRLTVSAHTISPSEIVTAEIDVDVPYSKIARYVLYLKASPDQLGGGKVLFRLYDERNRLIATQERLINAVQDPDRLVVAYVGDGDLPDPAPRLPRRVVYQTVHAKFAPDRVYGYDGVDAVVISRYGSNLFDVDRLKALEEYVRAGGRLVALGGRDANFLKGSPIESWLPATVGELEDVSLDVLTEPPSTSQAERPPTAVARLTLLNGQAVWQRGDRLLAARRPMGLGSVEQWAFDLSARATGVYHLWSALFGATPQRDRKRDFLDIFTRGFSFGLRIQKPNLFVIGLALLLYFAMVGPLNFRMLSKRGQLDWGWVTVPAIVLIFSVAIYTVAYLAKGGESVNRTFSLIQTRAGVAEANVTSIGGYFSPGTRRRDFEFQMNDDRYGPSQSPPAILTLQTWVDLGSAETGLIRPEFFQAGYFGAVNLPNMGQSPFLRSYSHPVRQNDSKMTFARLPVSQWSLSYFEGERLITLPGTIDAALRREGNQVLGHVTNNSRLTVHDAFLKVGERETFLGMLAPGTSAQISGMSLRAPNASGALSDMEKEFRGRMNDQVLNRWPLGPRARGGDIPLLVGFLDRSPMRLQTGVPAQETTEHAMIICECPPVVSETGAGVSMGQSRAGALISLVAMSEKGVTHFPNARDVYESEVNDPGVELDKAEILYAFEPPLDTPAPPPARVTLYVRFHQFRGIMSAKNQDFLVEALNHRSNRFDILNASAQMAGQIATFTLGPDYANPFSGKVITRVRSAYAEDTSGVEAILQQPNAVSLIDVGYQWPSEE